MTSRVPRGEIQRTVCVAVSAARAPAAPTPDSNDNPIPVAAARLRKSARVISLTNTSSILFSIFLLLLSLTVGRACGSRLPAGPALADEVEDHVDQDAEDRDDQDRRPEFRHPRERRVVDEVPS